VPKGIHSILLGFRLLRALTDADAPMSLKTLAAVSNMSPSKARMYLISFIQTGLIRMPPSPPSSARSSPAITRLTDKRWVEARDALGPEEDNSKAILASQEVR